MPKSNGKMCANFCCSFAVLLLLLDLPPIASGIQLPIERREPNWTATGYLGKIRVLFYHNPPDAIAECRKFPYLRRTSMKCRFPGHTIEILTLITNHLRLKIEPVIHHTTMLGRYDDNGTAHGLLALLANGTVDTICKRFARNARNKLIYDFSRTLHATRSSIAVRRFAGHQSREGMWNLFYPFTASTWLTISTMLLAQLLVFAVITNAESRIIRRPTFNEFQMLWRMFRVQLQQPDGVRFYSISGRFSAFVFGLLQCMLILSLYQSYIVTSLVGKKQDMPFQSLDELIPYVESGKYRFAAPPINHWFFDMVDSHVDPRYRRLKRALQKYPVELYENYTYIMELVQSGSHVAVVQDDSALKWEALAFCDVVFVFGGMPEKAVHFMFPKGSKFVNLFNEGIGHEAMFMQRKHWKYAYLASERRNRICFEHETQIKRFKPLGIIPFLGLCIVLLIGLVLASLTFVTEVALFYYKRGKQLHGKQQQMEMVATGEQRMANALRPETLETDSGGQKGD